MIMYRAPLVVLSHARGILGMKGGIKKSCLSHLRKRSIKANLKRTLSCTQELEKQLVLSLSTALRNLAQLRLPKLSRNEDF